MCRKYRCRRDPFQTTTSTRIIITTTTITSRRSSTTWSITVSRRRVGPSRSRSSSRRQVSFSRPQVPSEARRSRGPAAWQAPPPHRPPPPPPPTTMWTCCTTFTTRSWPVNKTTTIICISWARSPPTRPYRRPSAMRPPISLSSRWIKPIRAFWPQASRSSTHSSRNSSFRPKAWIFQCSPRHNKTNHLTEQTVIHLFLSDFNK